METYTLHRGNAALLISPPHAGTAVPDGIAARRTDSAARVPDTDWHVSKLYGFVRSHARFSGEPCIATRHDFVVNGRSKGGYITRQYGDSARNIQAVQLEIGQRICMDEDSYAVKAAQTQVMLRERLGQMLA